MANTFNLTKFYDQGYFDLGNVIRRAGVDQILKQLKTVSIKRGVFCSNYSLFNKLEAIPFFKTLAQYPYFSEVFSKVYSGMDTKVFNFSFHNKHPKAIESEWKRNIWNPVKNPVASIIIALDDITVSNGAFRLIPQSHLSEITDDKSYGYIDAEMQAGDAIIYNNRCVHMTTKNEDNKQRRFLHLVYSDFDTFTSNKIKEYNEY